MLKLLSSGTTSRALRSCLQVRTLRRYTSVQRTTLSFKDFNMGKKKGTKEGAYNDFLDGERLDDNTYVRTSLNARGEIPRVEQTVGPKFKSDKTGQDRKSVLENSEQSENLRARMAERDGRSGRRRGKGDAEHEQKDSETVHTTTTTIPTTHTPTTVLTKIEGNIGASAVAGQPRQPHGPAKQNQPRPTHFLAIPLLTTSSRPQLQENLAILCNQITASSQPSPQPGENQSPVDTITNVGLPRPIHPGAIRPLGTLHLTLGVLNLSTASSLAHATSILHSLDLRYIFSTALADADTKNEKIKIDLRGLQPMHKPHETSVLYAAPWDETGVFARLAGQIRDLFERENILLDTERPLKLHATLLNTIYAPKASHNSRIQDHAIGGTGHDEGDGKGRGQGRGRGRGRGGRRGGPMKFDARPLIKKFEDTVWAKGVEVRRVQICRMGAVKVRQGEGEEGDGEKYIVEDEVEF